MKRITILLLLVNALVGAQNFESKDWNSININHLPQLTFTKTEILKYQQLTFKVEWNPKLSYSNNIGYYGGIGVMKIYYKNQLLQTIKNIEDGVALGEIYMWLFDFNMDGFLDFSIRSHCGGTCYDNFYIYNPAIRKFEQLKEWGSVRIIKINTKTKQILNAPDGTAGEGVQILYKIIRGKLTVQKNYIYGAGY